MQTDRFSNRHIGPRNNDIKDMLSTIGLNSVDELIDKIVPDSILLKKELKLDKAISEYDYQKNIAKIIAKNKIYKTYIGTGYYNTISPAVIIRNVLENPVWYTSYTPYQAEISQGRLEALLNFQTVITELTACEIANASLLDEATAASEAMIMMANSRNRKAVKEGTNVLFVDENIFPQTLEVILGKAEPLDIKIETGSFKSCELHDKIFGAIIQYPANDGKIYNYSEFTKAAHEKGILVSVAADLLSLAILTPPGEWDADIVFGTTQRFGIPMGYGGPHAAYFATRENFKRKIPGRIIGVSKDVHGNKALRMALQTREQHIKREKATSNICTAQALLATMAGMYAVYHGKEGLIDIASSIHAKANIISEQITKLGYKQENENYFDTLKIQLPDSVPVKELKKIAIKKKVNFRYFSENRIGISINETTSILDINNILRVFSLAIGKDIKKITKIENSFSFNSKFKRRTSFLKQDVFKKYHSETEMMRYIKMLERKDMSLTHSMISLGSCTMKLNPATLMMPLSSPYLGEIHPFVPKNQAKGYHQIFEELKNDLLEITGFDDITFQPNSGASGEYTGLMIIREYQKTTIEENRNIVLIPASAHGTNPASAVMAGMEVVIVKCDENGNIDVEDLKAKAEEHKENLSAMMITYPSTHGVFETEVVEMCKIIHKNGGQVYMDGANMNAQVGITNPAKIGADVCHLNLHKTFAIPHGGGGPGVGPVAVAKHLSGFLPGHPTVKTGGKNAIKAVSAAPWGSASILGITHGYLKMLGADGLLNSTKTAILNANYIAASLKNYFKILYTGKNGYVAHEMILECRNFKQEADINEADIAKRLMDYGFHAPTLSFPVHGTLMVEPTESESKQEMDKFIESMISIYNEIQDIKNGKCDKHDNMLKNAPHCEQVLISDNWEHKYSRETAAYPLSHIRTNKFQIPVGRIDDAYGDRNLFCTCDPVESFE
ncbi:MAG: aminomethyl-transferring glycine dehydrogenase [Bacteroidales bacterium]|nr:aminomethyl-transferring glycine dehydrogenase [Bacteroidales bacterium]